MKSSLLLAASAALLLSACSDDRPIVEASFDVIPCPQAIDTIPGRADYILDRNTVIRYTPETSEMERHALFLQQYAEDILGYRIPVKPGIAIKPSSTNNGILLRLEKGDTQSEAYDLLVSTDQVWITSTGTAGIFYGIQTLRKALATTSQLKTQDSEAKTYRVSLPTVHITDAPRFAYRGMHLDCSRHFYSVEFVKEYIDLIALHGMNRFHWHITDDQGWRFEVKKYPRLTQVGGWRSGTIVGRNSIVDDGQRYGGFYTQEECREIVKYAADRFITIVPEIDMPGHMVAALAAYPELGCTGGPYEVEHHWGVFADVLCPGKEKTFQFVEDVLSEVIDVFPSTYIHIGGDESPRDRWKECPLCQQRIHQEGIKAEGKQSAEDRLQGYFTKRVEKFLHAKGKRLIGWDELLGCDIDTTATIMSWTGAEPGARGAKLGHDVIMTPNSPMYFDHYQTDQTWNEPLAIGGHAPVQKVYAFEPVAEDLTPAQARRIHGAAAYGCPCRSAMAQS